MPSRFGALYLGQVHPRKKLERRRDLQKRPRTNHARAVRLGAPSDLHRTPHDVGRNRDCARARRWHHRAAIGVREHLDQIAARRKTHAPEIPGPIHGVSTPRETPDTFHSLAALLRPGADSRAALEPSIISRSWPS